MRSSYMENSYGDVLYAIVTAWRPLNCVELGVLDGYSTINIARGLQENKRLLGVLGHLDSYDLFEDYPFKHGSFATVQEELGKAGIQDFVTLHKADAFGVVSRYSDESIGLLHVDLSNTGDTLRRIAEDWDPKMLQGGLILFEGGTEERDQVEWMVKFNKAPIKPEVESNPILNSRYVYCTYLKYPGLTCFLKKR